MSFREVTFKSYFAGIGGFDLGFERAGMTCLRQVEIDSHCQMVLARHWPNVARGGDINSEDDEEYCDVICGGFPCQDLSVAGNRRGLAGGRSGLFWSLLHRVDRIKPEFVVWENVGGLRSSDDGRDFQRVLRGFADIGYFGAVRLVDCRWWGIPQRRKRFFGVFARCSAGTEWQRACEVLAVKESLRRNSPESRTSQQRIAACLTSGVASSGVSRPGRRREDDVNLVHTLRAAGADASEDGTGRGTPLIPAEIYQCHGSSVGPVGTLRKGNGNASGGVPFVAASLNSRPFADRGDDVNLIPSMFMANDHSSGGYGEVTTSGTLTAGTDKTRGLPLVCQTLNASDGGASSGMQPVIPSQQGVRRLTPRECERCQGFPDDFTRFAADGSEISDSRRYAMIGNSVVPQVAEWIGKRLMAVVASEYAGA